MADSYWTDEILGRYASGELPVEVKPDWVNAPFVIERLRELAVIHVEMKKKYWKALDDLFEANQCLVALERRGVPHE